MSVILTLPLRTCNESLDKLVIEPSWKGGASIVTEEQDPYCKPSDSDFTCTLPICTALQSTDEFPVVVLSVKLVPRISKN